MVLEYPPPGPFKGEEGLRAVRSKVACRGGLSGNLHDVRSARTARTRATRLGVHDRWTVGEPGATVMGRDGHACESPIGVFGPDGLVGLARMAPWSCSRRPICSTALHTDIFPGGP